MSKTPVVLVTFYRRGAHRTGPGRTIAFDVNTRKPLRQFCKNNLRPYESASAAIRRAGTYEEVSAFWGIGWLRSVAERGA